MGEVAGRLGSLRRVVCSVRCKADHGEKPREGRRYIPWSGDGFKPRYRHAQSKPFALNVLITASGGKYARYLCTPNMVGQHT